MNLNIDYLAKLSKLSLSEEEEEKLEKDLEKVLDYMDYLKNYKFDFYLDLAENKSTMGEDDLVKKFADLEDLKNTFPRKNGNYLEVPAILKENKAYKKK